MVKPSWKLCPVTSHLWVLLMSNPKLLLKGWKILSKLSYLLDLLKLSPRNQRLGYVRQLSQHLDRLLNLKLFLEQLRHLQSLTYLLSQSHLNSRSPVLLLNLSLMLTCSIANFPTFFLTRYRP